MADAPLLAHCLGLTSFRVDFKMNRDPITQLVTFATPEMSRSQELCYLSSLTKGKIRRAFQFRQYDLELLRDYEAHKDLFDAPRGPSFWAWKPALINKLMGPDSFVYDVHDGDILIYADVGVEFIAPVSHIIERMDQDIFLFGNNWEHAHWCKRDVIDEVWPYVSDEFAPVCDISVTDYHEWASWARFGKQVQASVIFFRVSDYTRAFVAEWLKWCLFEGGRLIDDSPSRAPNHPEFQEHRHDQAILTTMAYREGCKLHYWPASYNDGAFNYEKLPEYAGDDYPVIFSHHRKRNHEWQPTVV